MRSYACVLSAILVLGSCKRKSEDQAPPAVPVTTSDFSKLAVGNYWVYERTAVDSLGNEQPGVFGPDSLVITSDSLLDGATWYVMRRASNGSGAAQPYALLRDSADCLVERTRGIQYCTDRFDQVLQTDSIFDIVAVKWRVNSTTEHIVVPAASGDCHGVTAELVPLPASAPHMFPPWKAPRSYRVSGIGLLRWFDFYANSPTGYRYDLLRYHVQ